MSEKREELRDTLRRYTMNTLLYINTVKEFCGSSADWIERRTSEMSKMRGLKSSKCKPDKQQKLLEAVLKGTRSGLEKLDIFLEAVEKLAVTSLHVFIEGIQVIQVSEGLSLEHVQAVVIAARQVCPLLLEFKRDANAFFLPRLQNVELLANQLDRYIQTTQRIFEKLELSHLSLRIHLNIAVNLEEEEFSEDDVQRMLCHINHLADIRMDPDFRLVFLFQGVSCSGFIKAFTRLQPRFLQFLKDQEEIAVRLDSVNKQGKIVNIVGSSVGLIGGGLAIAGLVLAPVTAGLSLSLTMGATGCGIASAGIAIANTARETGVNYKQINKTHRTSQRFMEDVQSLHDCLDEVTTQTVDIEVNLEEVALGVCKIAKGVYDIESGIDSMVEAASSLRALRSAGRGVARGNTGLRSASRVVADIPETGQAALRGPLALSKTARCFYIGLNAVCIGMDIYSICENSISLYRGSETEVSKSIRARVALWRSEINAWEKIHDSLCKGLLMSEQNIAVLFKPFYNGYRFDNLGF
ncbi:uncharacterized protein LOC141809394 [Halichoeres trimaculatus]|uniref:uncharacterized protein LOC141809394 n=1 Tax=Halichoeres trimaculatus TaxID=147232 RepID=UPI003D9F7951